MARITREQWYRRVNAEWPTTVPPLSSGEAIRAARKLYRFAAGSTWRGSVKTTSGNRDTWIRRGTLYVNPTKGWKHLVHMLSHYVASDLPHGKDHACFEMRMIKEVKKRGWLEGGLRDPEKQPAPSSSVVSVAKKQRHAEAMLKRAETRLKRAETIAKKWRVKTRYYERRVSAEVANRGREG